MLLATLFAAGVAGVGAQLGCSEPATPPPNLVLITLDTLRADRLGSYGYADARTPVLDAIAARGVRFEDAVSQATTTPPSHASILTGLNPARHGLRKLHGQRLSDSNETLAEILQAHGYTTAAFVSDLPLGSRTGLDQGFDVYDELTQPIEPGAGEAGDTNSRVFAWLAEEPEQPLFLWVHYFDPHHPYFPPAEQREAVGLGDADWAPRVLPRNTHNPSQHAPQPAVVEAMRKLYDAEIAYTDEMVGKLLERLEAAGILDNAVIAYVADHGEHLGEDGYYFGHWDVLDETARVPMVIAHSDGRHAGRVVDSLVGSIDLVPTLLSWMGIEVDLDFDGRDLTPLARGDEAGPEWRDRAIYTEQFEYFPVRAVRGPEWMLRQAAAPRGKVRDAPAKLRPRSQPVPADPAGPTGPTGRAEPAPDRRALQEALGRALDAAARPRDRHATERVELSDEVRAQLRALGYTDEARGPEDD
jgi:arylsulfatase A-like enzyme